VIGAEAAIHGLLGGRSQGSVQIGDQTAGSRKEQQSGSLSGLAYFRQLRSNVRREFVGPELKFGGVLFRAPAVKNRQIPERRQETHSPIL